MTKRVRLHVYSGREDPVWALTDDQVGALQEILGAADVSAAAPLRRRLGYRGFSVLGASPGVEADVGDAAESEGAGGRVVVGVQEAELFLVQSAPAALMDDLGDYLTAAIADVPTESDESGHAQCPPCKATQAPAYNPAYWNNNPSILYNNNCYNYANDKVTGTFAQPGRGSGQMYSQLACAGAGGVEPAAVRDGLRVSANFSTAIQIGWYAALVIWPGRDFHWYRQDDVGCWSHKPGSTAVRDVDNAGQRITDPRTCDRGPYTDFCSYMITDRSVTIA